MGRHYKEVERCACGQPVKGMEPFCQECRKKVIEHNKAIMGQDVFRSITLNREPHRKNKDGA